MNSKIEARRAKRQKRTAEIFTPLSLVNQMLDKLPANLWDCETKTFCDPACGNGNILIPVLERKINMLTNSGRLNTTTILNALQSIYGCDIMLDNIRECRLRLLKVVALHMDVAECHTKVVIRNIKWTPLHIYPRGSLDYKFDFKDCVSDEDAKRLVEQFAGLKTEP